MQSNIQRTISPEINAQALGEADFNDKILECIDQGLDKFGPKIKYFIYWHYTEMSRLTRFSIVASYGEFSNVLENLFGKGSEAIESAIVSEIKREFRLASCHSREIAAVIHEARRVSRVEEDQ